MCAGGARVHIACADVEPATLELEAEYQQLIMGEVEAYQELKHDVAQQKLRCEERQQRLERLQQRLGGLRGAWDGRRRRCARPARGVV